MKKNELKFGNVLRTYRNEWYLYTFDEDGRTFLELSYVDEDGKNQRGYDDLNENFVFNGDSEMFIKIPVTEIYEDFTCKKLLWEGNKDFDEKENKANVNEALRILGVLAEISTNRTPENKVNFDKPCLLFEGRKKQEILGYLGTKTNIKDIEGNELFVGDIVKIETEFFESEAFVIQDDEKFGVMGMMASPIVDGKNEEFIIRKIKSYTDLKHNEFAGPLVIVKAKFFCEEE